MTKTTRIKAPAISNRAAFDLTVDTIASATTRLRKLEAARDAKIQTIQREHAAEITEIQEQIKLAATMAEKYAEEHRDELLPGKARSAETPLARYGFRTGMPQLKLLAKWYWEKVVAAIDARGLGDEYVIVSRQPAKARMIAALTTNKILGEDTEPSQVGVRLIQTEAFFIEPKVEGAETVKAGAVA